MRVAVTLLAGALLLLGTLRGDDDAFPFGPFSMYSSARNLDEPVGDTRLYGIDQAGEELLLLQSLTGLRRAEIEGQLPRFTADPSLLALVAKAYERRNPEEPPLRQVQILVRWNELRDGQPTGRTWDEVVTTWRR